MESSTTSPASPKTVGLTLTDKLFVLLLLLTLVGVAWVGRHSFNEGLKTETAKRNGEAWLNVLKAVHANRNNSDAKPEACAKTSGEGQAAHNWEACYEALKQTPELARLTNPYQGGPLGLIEACVAGDLSTSGALVIKRVDPNPPGSATPVNVVNFSNDTTLEISRVLQVKVCDRGGYTISIGEVEF